MQIFVAVDDAKTGPFTLFQIEERLRSGDLKEDQLVWHEGLPGWQPLGELDPFKDFFRVKDAELEEERRRHVAEKRIAYEQKRAESLPKSTVRPWTRFWARNLDFFFFLTATLLIFTGLRQLGWITATASRFMEIFPIFLPFWHLLEAYCISQWGTTAGKSLLGIHITDAENNRLGFRASLRRSLGVYVLGVGCYIFGLSLIAYAFGFVLLRKNRRSFWDVSAESYVHHVPLLPRHIFLPLAIVFLILTLFQGPFGELAAQQARDLEELRKAMGGQSNAPL